MANKVQTQLLVNLITRQRADALAVVMGEPRAEILRRALEGSGLSAMEREQFVGLSDLYSMGYRFFPALAHLDFAERAARDGFTLADLRRMETYPERTGG